MFIGAQIGLEVNIRYFYPLRVIAGRYEDKVEVDAGTTVENLLGFLSKMYGEEFERYVYSGIRQKGLPVIFLLDGRNVLQWEGLKTKLVNGCILTIMPPIAGG